MFGRGFDEVTEWSAFVFKSKAVSVNHMCEHTCKYTRSKQTLYKIIKMKGFSLTSLVAKFYHRYYTVHTVNVLYVNVCMN